MKQKIYIAYGTDMDTERMKRICPGACLIGYGVLPDYKLTFKYKGLSHIEPAQGKTVPVMLWQVSDGENKLDAYHKYPKMREKIELQVQPILSEAPNQNSDQRAEERDELQPDPKTAVNGYTYVMKDEYAQYAAAPNSEDYSCLFEVYVNNFFDLSALPAAYEEALIAAITP